MGEELRLQTATCILQSFLIGRHEMADSRQEGELNDLISKSVQVADRLIAEMKKETPRR